MATSVLPLLPLLLLLSGSETPATAVSESSYSAKHLLIDPRVVDADRTLNAEVAMGAAQKHGGRPLVMEDQPWEHTFLNMFPSIWYDPQLSKYRMWYWAAAECGGKICPKDPTARPPGKCNIPADTFLPRLLTPLPLPLLMVGLHFRASRDGQVQRAEFSTSGHGLRVVSAIRRGNAVR
jgi:hypothetical protein